MGNVNAAGPSELGFPDVHGRSVRPRARHRPAALVSMLPSHRKRRALPSAVESVFDLGL